MCQGLISELHEPSMKSKLVLSEFPFQVDRKLRCRFVNRGGLINREWPSVGNNSCQEQGPPDGLEAAPLQRAQILLCFSEVAFGNVHSTELSMELLRAGHPLFG